MYNKYPLEQVMHWLMEVHLAQPVMQDSQVWADDKKVPSEQIEQELA